MYSWTGGVTDGVAFTPTATGTYTVTGTSNGCSATSTQTITVNAIPTVGSTATANTVCAGTAVTLTGTGATTYSWTVGITNGAAFTPTATATYTLTGTSNGCSNTSTQTITVIAIPTVGSTATANTICAGTSVTLIGTGATTYSWTGGVTDGVAFTPTATGTYTVTGTSNGCSATSTQTITVNAIPTVGSTATANTVCAGTAVTLTGTGATTYSWTGGVTNGAAFTPTATGTYTVTGTTNGCSNTSTQTITINAIPTVGSTATANTVCAGTAVTLTGTGATTYSWTGGVTDGVAFTPTATGTYTVTGTSNGCSATSTQTVTILSPYNITASVGANGSISPNGTTVVCSGNNQTYTITPNAGYQILDVLVDGVSNAGAILSGSYTFTNVTTTHTISSIFLLGCTMPLGSASNIVICNGDPSNVPLSSTVANTDFTWTSTVTTGGVIGNNDCVSGCGTTIADVLTNTGSVHAVVQYTVIPTSPGGCVGAPFTVDVTVGAAPAAPVISGPNALCGLTSAIYTVAAVPEATSYVWTVPTGTTGMTITSGQGTTSLHVSISAGTVSGDVTCTAVNNCGSSVTTAYAVTKKPAVPGAITGPTSTCGQTSATYSVAPVFGATSYIWTLPAGMTASGASNLNSITVNIASAFIYGQVKVSAVNACGNVPGTGLYITGNSPAIPVTLSGPANVCGLTTGTYSIPAVAGATGYNWIITGAGNSISGSNTGTTVTAILAGPGVISVAGTNLCGTGPYRALNLVTSGIQPGTISGPLNTCGLTTATYSVAPVANAASYTWGLATGMTWGTGQGTNVINVNIAPSVGSTTAVSPLKVAETNTCGNISLYRTTTITRCLSPDAMNTEGGNTFSNVYPNPTSAEFTMDVTVYKDQEIVVEVFDILGNIVISEKHNLVSGTSTMKTNMEQFNRGMYFVRILDANSNVMHTERVVKQ